MSDITASFDAPWTEPVEGVGDVKFARADMAYWSAWADAVKAAKIAKDLAALAAVKTLVDPLRRMEYERRIQDQPVYLGDVIDRQHTPAGLAKILRDALVRAGSASDAKGAEAILNRIGPGRQMALAEIVCSEPRPTIDQYREAVRTAAIARGMDPMDVARLTDAELIGLARDVQAPPTADLAAEGQGDGPLGDPDASTTGTPALTGI